LDAKAAAEATATAKKKAEETQKALAGKTDAELEAARLSAYNAFQAKQTALSGKTATAAEKEELEKLKREWDATRAAQAALVSKGINKELWDARAKKGLAGIRTIIDVASKSQIGLAKKAEEFPAHS